MILSYLLLFFIALPGFSQEEDEFIHALEDDRKRQMEAAIKLDQGREQLENSVFNAADELKKLGHDTFTATAMMDEKVVELAQKVLKESHLYKVPPEEVRKLILLKAKNSKLHGFLLSNPRVLDFLVDVLRDRDALSSLTGIFLRKEDLKFYLYIWIGLLISVFLIKRYIFPKKWKGFKRFSMSLLLSLSCTFISLLVFYFMFQNEISPLGEVIKRHL